MSLNLSERATTTFDKLDIGAVFRSESGSKFTVVSAVTEMS